MVAMAKDAISKDLINDLLDDVINNNKIDFF